ncbi:hypothetical protein Bca52824_072699 [Brassica carinata]|uniref:WAT1-related protein n=1 Tax=Brassica carinata TaxID=52824 RepID=A0A8X7U462_BRACI|nr:hypothetical protein Bca52824_072699 [Brassica carinata]
MEADFMAQLGGDEAHEEAEVQDVSSTAPQPTQVLRRSSRLASLLFGDSLGQNLYFESMAVTSATFMSAVANLVPAITFIVGIFVGLERLEFGTAVGKAKVFGTIMGIGGAMLFTFYKGFPIQPLKSDINLLPGTSTGHVALLASDHRVLGACLALASCFSYAIWIILQHNEMKKRINEVVPSNENEAQKSVEIIVVSGSNRISSIEMKMTENGTISERKDGVCVDREERTLADPR